MHPIAIFLAIYVALTGVAVAQKAATELPTVCIGSPELNICKRLQEFSFDEAFAKSLMDSEFKRLNAENERFGRAFAINSFAASNLPGTMDAYAQLRDRALVASFAAEAENGQRYFSLESVGYIAHSAGDEKTALQTLNERRKLVENRTEDQSWTQNLADIIFSTTEEEAWLNLSRDASSFGYQRLAKSILLEAYPSEKPTYKYQLALGIIENTAGNNKAAEKAAREAIKTAPYIFCADSPEEKAGENLISQAHIVLIEALEKQGKPIQKAVKDYTDKLSSRCTYLSGHKENFYGAVIDLSEFSQDAAREVYRVAELIDRADGEDEIKYGFSFKEEACEVLKDQDCLRQLAADKEKTLIEEDPYYLDDVSLSYVTAGEYAEARRIMEEYEDVEPTCFQFTRYFGISSLIEDKDFAAAKNWLEDWVRCRNEAQKPNWQSAFGMGGNLWSDISSAYAQLSRSMLKAGNKESAKEMAINSLALAVETKITWKVEYSGHRANTLGEAFGAAYGALVVLSE